MPMSRSQDAIASVKLAMSGVQPRMFTLSSSIRLISSTIAATSVRRSPAFLAAASKLARLLTEARANAAVLTPGSSIASIATSVSQRAEYATTMQTAAATVQTNQSLASGLSPADGQNSQP